MSSFYLVGKNRKNGMVSIIMESDDLEKIDYYTTNYHNRRNLSEAINDGVSKDMDFFIVKPIVKGNTTFFNILDVLYSNSKEVRLLNDSKKSVDNLIDHFYDKMRNNLDFYDMVINHEKNIYPRFKNYFTHEIMTSSEELKEKDGGWITEDYNILRNMVSSLSRFERRKRSKKSDSRVLLEKLILEKRVASKIEEDDRQLNFFKKIKKDVDDNKLLEVMCLFRHLYEGFLEIRDGEVRLTNNLITNHENLELLDTLLDQRVAYPLFEYLRNRYKYGLAIDDESKNKYQNLVEDNQREMIEVLMSNVQVLNDAYKWSLIISINKDRILGDYNGKKLYK